MDHRNRRNDCPCRRPGPAAFYRRARAVGEPRLPCGNGGQTQIPAWLVLTTRLPSQELAPPVTGVILIEAKGLTHETPRPPIRLPTAALAAARSGEMF